MSKIKICPACNQKNKVTEPICEYCFSDISSVAITEEKNKGNCFIELVLLKDKTKKITILKDSFVGRDGNGSELLYFYETVSRFHAKFYFTENRWYIEDNQSTNGTYHNDVKLAVGEKVPLQSGDQIYLSSSVGFEVVIYR